MIKLFTLFFGLLLCLLTTVSFAQETAIASKNAKIESVQVENILVKSTLIESTPKAPQLVVTEKEVVTEKTPEVGKHAMANIDASSMILSLLMVLALILISAFVLKRFNLTQQGSNQLKVIASLSLGAKEKIIVVQIGEQQLVLGVCPQQISLLKDLENPIDIQVGKPLALSGNVLSFLQKNSIKTNSIKKNTDNNITTNETTNK